jgi:hypothetical protein
LGKGVQDYHCVSGSKAAHLIFIEQGVKPFFDCCRILSGYRVLDVVNMHHNGSGTLRTD